MKPDALEQNKAGSIIKYYEDAGLKILDMRFLILDRKGIYHYLVI